MTWIFEVNDKTEEIRRVHVESALLDFGVWVVCTKASKNLAYMFEVLIEIVRVGQDVV
jgi:hypothetical protein